jgi:hypothetical protein
MGEKDGSSHEMVTTKNGHSFKLSREGDIYTMTSDGHHIVVVGDPGAVDLSFSGIGDAIADAVGALLKILTCKPYTTTTVETHKDGTATITTTTQCAPG